MADKLRITTYCYKPLLQTEKITGYLYDVSSPALAALIVAIGLGLVCLKSITKLKKVIFLLVCGLYLFAASVISIPNNRGILIKVRRQAWKR
ncbi:MAG: hypothetical protein V4448_08350 [Pseudomonadota bacterium]